MAIPTPYSYRQYAGDGLARSFSIPFPYLQRSHVHLYLGHQRLVEGVDYSWTSGTQVQVVVPPTDLLTVRRVTPEDGQVVPWNDGSYVIEADLNTSDRQWLYLLQEHHDQMMRLQYGVGTLPGAGNPLASLSLWNRLARRMDPAKGTPEEVAATVDGVDQKAGDWVSDDAHVATTSALSERFDVIMSGVKPPDPLPTEQRQGGKLWIDTAQLEISYWDPVIRAWVNLTDAGPAGPPGGGVASVTGVAPIQVAAGTTTPVVSITPATASAAGSMSAADKAKLNTLQNYALPIASATVLGGIKVGSNLVMDPATGVLSGNLPGALVYKGIRDVTAPAPALPGVGHVYVNSVAGIADPSWTGLIGWVPAGDLLLWDGFRWGHVGTSGDTSDGTVVVSGTAPVRVGGSASAPVVSVDLVVASSQGIGGSNGLMSAADKERLDAIPDGAASGTVTQVSGAGAVKVTNGTTTPTISVDPATAAAAGLVQLADGPAITAGTAGRVVDAAQLKATAPVAATTAAAGLVRLATPAEVVAGADATKAVTSAGAAQAYVAKDVEAFIKAIPQNAQTAAYALVAADKGKHVSITTGGVTVPASVFSVGDVVVIYNNSSSSQAIIQAGGVILRLGGSATTGDRTLAQRGLATMLCVAANEFVISGVGLS